MTSPTSRVPPRFVPTLTEVVHVPVPPPVPVSETVHEAAAMGSAAVAAPHVGVSNPSSAAAALPDGIEEIIIHRVMQRVDLSLDQRLRDAIATVVKEQTRSVLPRLREEIESVVRHAVYEAVADELATIETSQPIR